MLHAFNQKNVRRVLTTLRDEHVIGKDEDGVTSMVFSPLAFMLAEDAARILHEIASRAIDDAFSGRKPAKHEILLWPQGLRDRAWTGEGSTRCEPDFLIRFDFDDGPPVAIIGEMKWNWKVDARHLRAETDRQRRAVRDFYPEARQVVLTISKRRILGGVPGAIEKTWIQIHRAATTLARLAPGSPAGRWGQLVADFLALAEQMDFQGFSGDLPEVELTIPMFWKE